MNAVVASHNDMLVAEFLVRPNVVLVAGRVFRCEPEVATDGVFANPVNGDEIHTRREDGRLLVTWWKTATGDDTAALITGTEGSPVYRSNGRHISFYKLAQQIADAAP